jgi:TAT (twin-arginine translocation) pathway signal sequence
MPAEDYDRGLQVTTRDDGRSTGGGSGEFGLSRRHVVKGAGALALATAVGSAAPLASRAARAQASGTAGRVTTSDGVNLHYL